MLLVEVFFFFHCLHAPAYSTVKVQLNKCIALPVRRFISKYLFSISEEYNETTLTTNFKKHFPHDGIMFVISVGFGYLYIACLFCEKTVTLCVVEACSEVALCVRVCMCVCDSSSINRGLGLIFRPSEEVFK